MELAKLQTLLQQLHEELSDHQVEDAQVQAQLKELLQDINKQINNSAPLESQNDQAQNLAVSLEAEFPRLSATLREITDQLSKIGI
jgi:predicted transcriptional regulator